MKQLAVISGKGGTGKTILTASFAVYAQNAVLADCDVDAANLHLLLDPIIQEQHVFQSGQCASLVPDRCTLCGSCLEVCRFSAISLSESREIHIDPLACEGCAVCSLVCQPGAIEMKDAVAGKWLISQTRYGPLVHASLNIGAENSGKLVAEVRKQAELMAKITGKELIIIDGPPGIGCPVVASLSGVDLALVVTEPTPSGIHDMERVVQTARHFNIPTACCINKFDLNPELSKKTRDWCTAKSIGLAGFIPFDTGIVEAVIQATPPPEYLEGPTIQEIRSIWEYVLAALH